MNSHWNDFIQNQNLLPAPDCALHALDSLGLIQVEGEDARSFLQGQLSNDINKVDAQQAQFTSYNTHKGRMTALMLAFEHEGGLFLQLPRERLEAVLKRLRMFVLRARVELHDASDRLAGMGLSGECVNRLLPEAPKQALERVQLDGLSIIRMPDALPRVMLMGEAEQLMQSWRELSAKGAMPAEENHWWLLNLRAGIPNVFNATAEAFIPQMLNLDRLDGISFTKGCYTGQEVVARMKYLGELKRRMFFARFNSEQAPKPGDALYSAKVQSAQGAGKVVDARSLGEHQWEALVVAVIDAAQQHEMRLWDTNGPKLELQVPPYGFE